MTAAAKKQSLLLNFSEREARFAVTRETVKNLRTHLGFSNETQVVQFALSQLRDAMLPRYETDQGPVPETMLRHLRKLADQDTAGGTSLF
jgi:hypothetical protein